MLTTIRWGTVLLAMAMSAPLYAQDVKKPNGKDDPAKQEIEARILEIAGTVEIKRPEDKDWSAAQKDMKLKKNTEVCTAYASKCVLMFEDGKTKIRVEVTALSQIKIDENTRQKGKIETDVNIKFGTIEFDVKKGELEVDMKVSTPNSTTSVRGTNGRVSHFPDHARAMAGGMMMGGHVLAASKISTVSINSGTVNVTDDSGTVTQSVGGGETLSSPETLPMDTAVVQESVSTVTYGVTTEESAVTSTSNATYDTTTTYLESNLSSTETTTFVQVIPQQLSALPGPPLPPGQ